MNAVNLIYKKRTGGEFTPEEIGWFIAQYVRGTIPDYQAAAWLMAVCFRGLTDGELAALTEAMMRSGEVFDFSALPGVKADKHSTGGVGDKVSLILGPLAAACGLLVPMVAGRGLGHTGGTIDKLEAIPGYNANLTQARMRRQLAKIGVAIAGQTGRFVPADKKLYALRDVTATVESIPLISASIMSKKLAEGSDVLVLDVTVGSGAFMPDLVQARALAATMTGIARAVGRKVAAIFTNMDQPTGRAVGNANEVIESIEALQGYWASDDLREITLALTARMLTLGAVAKDEAGALEQMERALASGAALEKFRLLVEAQGGDPRVIDNPKLLPRSPQETVVTARTSGWLAALETRQIGLAATALGAGRETKEATIDPGAGLWVHAKIGDRIDAGQPIFTVRYRKPSAWEAARPILEGCFKISEDRVRPPRAILGELEG